MSPTDLPVKTIRFPVKLTETTAKIQVSPGQSITKGQSLAFWTNHQLIPLDISSKFSIQPHEIFHYLKRQLGDVIQPGELIASRSTFTGELHFYSPDQGRLTLSPTYELCHQVSGQIQSLFSPVSGSVFKIESDAITIQTRAIELLGSWGTGDQVDGQIVFLDHHYFTDLTLGKNVATLNHSLAVVDFPIIQPIYAKLSALGLLGIYCREIDSDLKSDTFRHSPFLTLIQANSEMSTFNSFNSLKSLLLSLPKTPDAWLHGQQKRLLIFT